jgi:hypothetical protein
VPARIGVIHYPGSFHTLTVALLAIPDKRQGVFRDDGSATHQNLPRPALG